MLNFRHSTSRHTAGRRAAGRSTTGRRSFRRAIAPLAALTLLSPLALAGCGTDSAGNSGQNGSNGANSAGGNGAGSPNGANGQGSAPQASAKRNPFFIIESDGGIKASPKPSTCSEAVMGGYQKVLAAPQDYARDAQDVRELPAGKRTFEYAMTDTNGDGCAEMLLVKRFYEFSAVVVVTVDGNGNPHATRDYIVDGAGSSGGGRQFVYASNDGNGVHEFSGQSIDQTWKFTTYVPAGDKLNKTSEEKIPTSSIQSRATAIDWINTSDASGLTRMQGGTGGGGGGAGGGTDSGAGDTGGGALSAGQ